MPHAEGAADALISIVSREYWSTAPTFVHVQLLVTLFRRLSSLRLPAPCMPEKKRCVLPARTDQTSACCALSLLAVTRAFRGTATTSAKIPSAALPATAHTSSADAVCSALAPFAFLEGYGPTFRKEWHVPTVNAYWLVWPVAMVQRRPPIGRRARGEHRERWSFPWANTYVYV